MDEARQQVMKEMTESVVKTENVENEKQEDTHISEGHVEYGTEESPAVTDGSYQQDGTENAYDPNAYPGMFFEYFSFYLFELIQYERIPINENESSLLFIFFLDNSRLKTVTKCSF